ncbi:hypothetical protein Goari_015283, partial [Gossypium aridum]|nr:hypothetical protein [Gossypium aridum]
AHKILNSFVSFEVKWVKRDYNKLADSLCNWALSKCSNLSFEMNYPNDRYS